MLKKGIDGVFPIAIEQFGVRRTCFFLLLLVLGCAAPSGHVACTDGVHSSCQCSLILASQIAEDTAVTFAAHPLQSSIDLVVQPVAGVIRAGQGGVSKRVLMPLMPSPGPIHLESEPVDIAELESSLDRDGLMPLQPARVAFYPEGSSALFALEDLVGNASRQIDILMYEWENDALGERIASLLAAKAGPNLRIRILIDGGGNLFFGTPEHSNPFNVNRVVCELAKKPYVEVIRTRNPCARFDHRKLVLIDQRVAWSGGRNFTKKAFFDNHDFSLVLDGPLVDQLQNRFERFWVDQGGRPRSDVCAKNSPNMQSYPFLPTIPNANARLVFTEPQQHHIEKALFTAVDKARSHIYLENFTFSDSFLAYKLACARKRGVDVRVILTFNSGTAIIDRTNRVTANRFLRMGIRVFAYPSMTHTKAATVDGCWTYVGTGNFDPLSLRRNYEMGFTFSACPLVAEIEERLFQQDMCAEWELTKEVEAGTQDYASEFISSLFF